MLRTAIAVAAIALGTTAVLAQAELVEQRNTLMKEQQRQSTNLSRMLRGQDPYDQAKVDAAFAKWSETAPKLQSLFPETAKVGNSAGEYRASPKIWENKADFDARLVKLIKDVNENRGKATDLDSLKVVFPAVRDNCDKCHDAYRVKKG